MPALTTTSYGVLALLALGPATTYQLATQMERSLGWIWPRAASRLYEEPKKLVAAGGGHQPPGVHRPAAQHVLHDYRGGPEALADWLAEPGTGTVLECQALVKIAYADHGTREGLLANLTALIDDATAKLRFGDMIARQYLDGQGLYPERLPLSGLMWRFLWELQLTVLRWARWARTQVEAWPSDLSELDAIGEFRKIVAAAGRPWDQPGDPSP